MLKIYLFTVGAGRQGVLLFYMNQFQANQKGEGLPYMVVNIKGSTSDATMVKRYISIDLYELMVRVGPMWLL